MPAASTPAAHCAHAGSYPAGDALQRPQRLGSRLSYVLNQHYAKNLPPPVALVRAAVLVMLPPPVALARADLPQARARRCAPARERGRSTLHRIGDEREGPRLVFPWRAQRAFGEDRGAGA